MGALVVAEAWIVIAHCTCPVGNVKTRVPVPSLLIEYVPVVALVARDPSVKSSVPLVITPAPLAVKTPARVYGFPVPRSKPDNWYVYCPFKLKFEKLPIGVGPELLLDPQPMANRRVVRPNERNSLFIVLKRQMACLAPS